MKKIFTSFILLFCLVNIGFIPLLQAQASPLPYSQDFNTGNDFTFLNSTFINKWNYGSAAGNTGSSIYISNDNGLTNNYFISGNTGVVHAVKELIVPAGTTAATPATIKFDWRAGGESSFDYITVWLVPATFTPIDEPITTGSGRIQVGGNLNLQQGIGWQTYMNTAINLSSFAGSNMKLIFEWRNDGSGGVMPGGAIDNIIFAIPTCKTPTTPTVANITANSATLGWTATTPAPANGYSYYISTSPTPPSATTAPTGNSTTTSVGVTGLLPDTVYYWWVSANCSATNSSILLTGTYFTTPQIPATLPYSQDFSTANDFGFKNNSQTNQWVYGTFTGNPANAIFVSDNNGVANNYNLTALSTSHAYRDIIIPAGITATSPLIVSFDWKGQGETTLDYMRVWLVPANFAVTAGTQITAAAGRIQLGDYFNLQNTWQSYINTNVNVTSFAGQTMRLVFEWRNNATNGAQTAIAVDNINIYFPTCKLPTALAITNVGATITTIGWTAPTPAPANGYEYYVSTSPTPPIAGTAPTGTTTGTTVGLTGLLPETTYYWWVRSVCSPTNISIWIGGTDFTTTQIPATLPYNQDFTTANDFGFNNGTSINKWVYGSAAGNPGNSIYISDNNGVANSYTINSLTTVHTYRDILVPATATATTPAILSFDWRAEGETTLDYMRVWLVPSTYTPVVGTQITTGSGRIQVGGNFNQEDTWQSYVNPTVNLTTFAGQTMRLVFEWRNSASGGTQTPIALDNINLQIPTCKVISVFTVNLVGSTTTTIGWTAPSPAPANGYEYYVSTSPTPPTAGTAPTGTTTGTSVGLTGLLPETTYYWWVRAVCSPTDSSIWTQGTNFTTTQIPATLPYNQTFTTANDFGFVNGTLINKWFYGSAAGNTGNSIYISNNNGVANAYTLNSLTTAHAYRDILIPATATATTPAILSFDWRAEGETTLDYMRVWLVPSTYTPVVGTQITTGSGRIQVGGNFNQEDTWQNYVNPNVNLASFAGQTMRLVFEWRNSASGGTQTPIALDNINLQIPTCKVPVVFTANPVGSTTATIGWTAPSPIPANGYQYYVSTSSIPPTAGTPPTGNTTATSVPLTGLLPNTTYYWWVRTVCSGTNISTWIPGIVFITTQIPATLPYSQDFTLINDFGISNGNEPNKWYYGAAVGNTPNSLYISNDLGVNNTYTINTQSTVHTYRDIAIPAGTTIASPAILQFDWRGQGESSWDYLKVWMVPSSYTPTPGTTIVAATGRIQIGGNLNQQDTWQNYLNTNVNISSFAGQTMRLIFEWRNDGTGGTAPAGAIDNINLFIPTCKVPTLLSVNTITTNGATISWTATTPPPALGYDYYVTTDPTPPTAATVPTGNTISTSIALNTLTPNSNYYFWVRAKCSNTDKSLWIAGPPFTLVQIPATIPYIYDFTAANEFGFTNGTQVNQWRYGAAAGNTPNAIYISNDNGVTNTYSINSLSTVHSYRDITVPAGTNPATISFDWKAQGETTLDYLRVWLVPATYNPVAGTQITAAAGRIQVGSNFNQQATWQSYSNTNVNISSFAAATKMRLVFEWRNSATGGTQEPGAIDNVKVLICNRATPTVTLGAVGHNSVTLSWNQDINGASYIVRYRVLGSGSAWISIPVAAAPFPATTNTYTVTNSATTPMSPVTQYEIEVAAVCNDIAGAYTNNQFTTRCDPTPPNVVISGVTNNSAVVTWAPLAINATYFLEYREVGSLVWIPITTPQPPASTFTLTGLGTYKTYEVRVANKCNNENTQNPWSNPQVFTTVRTCEIPPPGLTITHLTTTSAEVTWATYTGAGATGTYVLKYRKVGIPSWTTVQVNVNNYTITGLVELTKYEMQVANICTGTPGNFTPLYYFTTPTVMYCNMASTDFASEFISKVTVEPTGKPTMSNPSLGSSYTDYTAVTANFIQAVQGSTNNKITINKTVTGVDGTGVAVWIDFNRNGYFDLDERILADGPNMNTNVSGTFSIPTSAYVSNTDYQYLVMRVALKKGGIPVNCESFDNGEVEDYTVRISKLPVPNIIDQNEIVIFPNPVKSILNVKNISKKANYKIYAASGQLVSKGLILNNKIDVSRLINGVYVIDIEDEKGNVQKKFIKE